MTDHTWSIETIDGGHIGSCDCWVCSMCGASAGPVWPGQKEPTWDPFLAGEGAGRKLPEDCDEAARVIREVTIQKFRKLPKERPDISPHYASLIRDAVAWTPDKKNVTFAYGLKLKILYGQPRPSLIDVRKMLETAGFNTMPEGGLTDLVRELGEREYKKMRKGRL